MDTFEINASLRLLRSSVKVPHVPNAPKAQQFPNAAASSINFITSGKRLETLKSLRRQLRKYFSETNRSHSLNFIFIHSVFETVHFVLEELVFQHFRRPGAHQSATTTTTTDTSGASNRHRQAGVYAVALSRNEILESLHIVLDTVTNLGAEGISFSDASLRSSKNVVSMQEDCFGRMFLPDTIQLLGHESSDVQRNAIRFLLLYISRTNNLHRFLEQFIEYGLESDHCSIQFGALNAVSHLFVRRELRAENLSLLIGALGVLLLRAQLSNRHILYPTYTALERLHTLIGSRRFVQALQQQQDLLETHPDYDPAHNILTLFDSLQKRAPSLHRFSPQGVACDDSQEDNYTGHDDHRWKEEIGAQQGDVGDEDGKGVQADQQIQREEGDKGDEREQDSGDDNDTLRAWELGQFETLIGPREGVRIGVSVPNLSAIEEAGQHCSGHNYTFTEHSGIQLEHQHGDTDRDCRRRCPQQTTTGHQNCGERRESSFSTMGPSDVSASLTVRRHSDAPATTPPKSLVTAPNAKAGVAATSTTTTTSQRGAQHQQQHRQHQPGPGQGFRNPMKSQRTPSMGDIRLGAIQPRVSFDQNKSNKIDSKSVPRRGSRFVANAPQQKSVQSTSRTLAPKGAQAKVSKSRESYKRENVRRDKFDKNSHKPALTRQFSKSTSHLATLDYPEYSTGSDTEHPTGNMASTTSYMPGYMANYATLDADTLANLEYIPTLKDYYPYSYYYDPYYSAHMPPNAAAAAAAAAVATGPSLAGPAASIHYGNRHLLRFGIFPRVLVYQALSSLAEEQFAAVQAIVRVVRDAPPEHLALLIPHLDEFLTVFVAQLLLDGASNFKVILWTLDIVELLSERLKHRLHPFLSQIVFLLTKRLGDNRIVIRDSVIKVFHQLAHRYCPQELLDLLFKHASAMILSGDCSSSTTNAPALAFTSMSKLREELANRVTASLSTFPRGQLNLPKLCFDVTPLLVDRRSAVRLAALECTATLAQALGPHKLGSLMSAVHSLDTHTLTPMDLDRLVAAIQARLARRSLPRTGPDGNVTYVLRVPAQGDQPWFYRRIYDADLEWIAVGPTTPAVNVNALYKHNLVVPATIRDNQVPPTASSEASSDKQQAYKFSNEEERLARRELIGTADSEDIPPPVKGHGSRMARRTPSKERSPSKVNADQMAQDAALYTRDFSSVQQQREYEQRSRSLERSKTVQEYRPYGKGDYFMDKFVRGESIDDSDLAEAHLYRKSSCESLEAWRQYFGRFKKQLAEMAMTGTRTGNGRSSRPTSGAVYYSSPMPPYGVSPYYYYYCNGLSHSYHDLSSLQQQNMESIMKRSGFMTADSEMGFGGMGFDGPKSMMHMRESPIRSPPERKVYSGGVRDKRQSVSVANDHGDHSLNSQMLTVDQGLERSISMPAIPAGDTLEDSLMQANASEAAGNSNVISDEVIQELGMWDKAIQEEKKEGKSELMDSVAEFEADEAMVEDYPEEEPNSDAANYDDRGSAHASRMSRQQSKASEHEPRPVSESPQGENIPMVNVQNPTPSLQSAQSKSEELVSSDEQPVSPTKQRVVKFEEQETDDADEQEKENADKLPELRRGSRSDSVTVLAKSKGNAVAKTGIPGPPARRLSRVPQQLYIKTTPAIPMNANIQHILGNVARTEGPFEYPTEAVKAALVALHDNAWTTKVEGMLAVVRLATFHPHYLLRDQHTIARLLCEETRNLRSTVARSAIFTIGEIFHKLKSQLEPEMDILVQALLFKVGENSVFIREDIDRALSLMVDSMPQTRSIIALVTFGSNHRNTFVRRTSAQFVAILVERMGAMKCLLGPREMCEFILPSAARFVQDGSPHTRYFGRRMFYFLMQHPLFDRLLRKHISPGTYRNICGLLETIKRRGVGDKPADLYSPTVQAKDIDPRLLVVVGGPSGGSMSDGGVGGHSPDGGQ